MPELQGRRQTHRGQLLCLDEFEKNNNTWAFVCRWSLFISRASHEWDVCEAHSLYPLCISAAAEAQSQSSWKALEKRNAKQIHFHSFQRCLLFFSASRLEKTTVYGKCCQSKNLTAWRSLATRFWQHGSFLSYTLKLIRADWKGEGEKITDLHHWRKCLHCFFITQVGTEVDGGGDRKIRIPTSWLDESEYLGTGIG